MEGENKNSKYMEKIKVAVLMGGPSVEHDVSLASGKAVCGALDASRYDPMPVIIDRNGEWEIPFESVIGSADIAFIALHGEYGENGVIQSLFEGVGFPYTGSSARSSALGMNKTASAQTFSAHGLLIPEWAAVSSHGDWASFRPPFEFPVVVKPVDRGSSIGVNIVRNEGALKDALCAVFDISRHAMVQRYVSGRELSVGIVETEKGDIPLPPAEIIPKSSLFFDYDSKYSPDASKIVIPANLNKMELEGVQKAALLVHKVIGASGVTRSDFIMSNDGRIFVLEINTIPGMAKDHLLPLSAAAGGMAMPMLLDHIIAAAFRRFGVR
ncbi:MAG: D-alanine--D-alanine ligase [Candidatus Colwellbacteria bacterium]|nr:D-alanine--D-alanine ligase [Candidatus Colwellbacteria bacterium]